MVRLTHVVPNMEHMQQFMSCIGPIFVVIAAKNITYLLIQVRSKNPFHELSGFSVLPSGIVQATREL